MRKTSEFLGDTLPKIEECLAHFGIIRLRPKPAES
jgi:hypothetical protein